MDEHLICTLSFHPVFARENAHLSSEIEATVEETLLSYLRQYGSWPGESLEDFSVKYDLDELIPGSSRIPAFIKVEIEIPERLSLYVTPKEVTKNLRARLQIEYRDQLAGHIRIDAAIIKHTVST